MKKLLFILPVLALIAAGCNQTSNAIATRGDLETSYNKVRVAIVNKDQATFEANIEPAKVGATISNDQWLQGLVYVEASYPDLSQMKYITFEQKGDYAYYITQTELDDTKSINVTSFKFHYTSNSWKLTAIGSSQSLLKKSTAAENEAVLNQAVDALKAQIQ